MRTIFIKLFDCLIDHVQYSTSELFYGLWRNIERDYVDFSGN